LGELLAADVEVHGQIVVCPGLNDGAALDDTLLTVLDAYAGLATLGVVPLGVSAHTTEPELRPHTGRDAAAVLDAVGRWQARFLDALGRRLVFAADEYYLLARRAFPTPDEYEGYPQHENGIGMARAFADEVASALAGATERAAPDGHRGFFEWVDGAPAAGYRAKRAALEPDVRRPGPVGIVTGAYGRQVLAPLLPALAHASEQEVRLVAIDNEFFGGNIGVTGLLTGGDVAAALAREPAGHRYLLPDVVLSEGRFLDGTDVAALPSSVEIVPTNGAALVDALRR